MPIRYPIAFRGTARPSGCSAWRLKVPKIERLTHPKPYIVPKTPCSSETFCLFLPYLLKPKPYIVPKLGALPKIFACFSLICSSRNPISCRNSVLFRKFLLVSALFAHSETLYRAETRCFSENFCLFLPYLLIPKPYVVPKLGALPKPFAYFSLICSSRNPCFSWNLEWLCISVKPRFAFVISETCKPFSSLSAFSPFSATKAVLRV